MLQGQVRPASVYRKIEQPILESSPDVLGIDVVQLKPKYDF